MERTIAKPSQTIRIVFVALALLANAAILAGVGGLADHYYVSTRIAANATALARACPENTLDATLPASSNRQPTALRGDDADCNARRSS